MGSWTIPLERMSKGSDWFCSWSEPWKLASLFPLCSRPADTDTTNATNLVLEPVLSKILWMWLLTGEATCTSTHQWNTSQRPVAHDTPTFYVRSRRSCYFLPPAWTKWCRRLLCASTRTRGHGVVTQTSEILLVCVCTESLRAPSSFALFMTLYVG